MLTEIFDAIGYKFKDASRLELALIHKSYGNENNHALSINLRDNERLEFLGDAVLDFIISEMLLREFPDASEGELSKSRAGLVNEKTLAAIARDLGIGKHVKLGKGESATYGNQKDSILSSTLEAIVAALYLDGGIEPTAAWIKKLFLDIVKNSREQDNLQDYKTTLQELVQARFKSAPKYNVTNAEGPDHDKTFYVELLVQDKMISKGQGKSKKEAEQEAAQIALTKLQKDA